MKVRIRNHAEFDGIGLLFGGFEKQDGEFIKIARLGYARVRQGKKVRTIPTFALEGGKKVTKILRAS